MIYCSSEHVSHSQAVAAAHQELIAALSDPRQVIRKAAAYAAAVRVYRERIVADATIARTPHPDVKTPAA